MNCSYKDFKRNVIIRFLSLEKYNYIRNNLYKCDVSKNPEFQKNFNAFYRVRRNAKWRNNFYRYFEKVKNNKTITFDTIVKNLQSETGNIEASFASKLLATINPDMPIWDQYVLKNLKVEVDKTGNRLSSISEAYKEIIQKEQELLKNERIKKSIKEFQEEFKEYELSDIKALDYILWNSRDSKDI